MITFNPRSDAAAKRLPNLPKRQSYATTKAPLYAPLNMPPNGPLEATTKATLSD
jgi:hypothetical protein